MGKHEKAFKGSTIGLIGDGVLSIKGHRAYDRYADQCDRLGVYPLSWPAL